MIECKAKCPIFVVEDLLVLNGGMGARGLLITQETLFG